MARTEGIKRVLMIAREQLAMDIAYVSEFIDGEQVFRAVSGDAQSFGLEPGVGLPLETTYCQRMVEGKMPNIVADAKLDRRVNALEITGDGDVGAYIGVPVYLSGGRLYGTLCAASHRPNHELVERDVAFLHVLARVLGDQLDHTELERELRRLDLEAGGIRALLVALEARDHYTGSHSECVVELSQLVARELDLRGEELVQIQQVALLHDIGKLGIPDAILQKPGQLDERDWKLMREHPAIGAEIVASIQPLAHLAPLVRAEHERWDGTGYPDHLVGEEIPLASRIVFACDAYHAMTSDRPYRAALGIDEARRQLQANAGTQFDPTVVDALLNLVTTDGPPAAPSTNGRLT
jgi:HD-GYP domain-containing protein (c-di-GMP phosphodiesterase class II)